MKDLARYLLDKLRPQFDAANEPPEMAGNIKRVQEN